LESLQGRQLKKCPASSANWRTGLNQHRGVSRNADLEAIIGLPCGKGKAAVTCIRCKHDTAKKFGTYGKRHIQRYRCTRGCKPESPIMSGVSMSLFRKQHGFHCSIIT